MFVKIQDSMFASAINIKKFDVITVRRTSRGYALSAHNVPLQGDAFHDIATFSGEQQALIAFERLMKAIANNEPYWS